MKYKAIVLSLLLLLPLVAALAPKAEAVNTPSLWINPKDKKFWAPCIVSTEFTVDVMLFNNKDMTGVGVYAYDFYFNWDVTAGITILSAEPHFPWPEGEYFVIADEIDNDNGWYHLAVTALGTQEEGELTNVQISLLTLVFHIDEEPCWPDTLTTIFWLDPVELSTGCGLPIDPFEVDDGGYTIYSSQPDIHMLPQAEEDPDIVEKCICHTHTVTVMLSNISNVYGFGFTMTWDPGYLETDVQHITICPAFPPPYEFLYLFVGQGYLEVEVIRPCEKPPICSKDVCAVTIDFHSIADPQEGVVPFDYEFPISIVEAYVMAKCPDAVYYYFPGDLLYGGDITYSFEPLPCDLNLDCIVDIEDLAALAEQYGLVHPWSDLNAPLSPAPVDIYDFVKLGKCYGMDP